MSIKTYSKFYYGIEIDGSNSQIDLREGLTDYQVTLPRGLYSLTDFANTLATELLELGTQDYTVSINRDLRTFTIAAPLNFSLRFLSGPNTTNSAYEVLGFLQQDYTGSNSYSSVNGIGSVYYPQFILQNYVPSRHNQEANAARVNESASGIVENVTFGRRETMECNISYISDTYFSNAVRKNINAVNETLLFLDFCIRKGNIEFMEDENNAGNFEKMLLEKTQASSNGTGFQLYELFSRGLPDFYETRTLQFRKITLE